MSLSLILESFVKLNNVVINNLKTKKMKIKIKKVIADVKEIEVELELPYYTRNYNTFYKFFAEDRIMSAYVDEGTISADINDFKYTGDYGKKMDYEPCTEQEFNAAFTRALEILSKNVNLLVSVSGLPEPSEPDGSMVNPECYKELFKNEI